MIAAFTKPGTHYIRADLAIAIGIIDLVIAIGTADLAIVIRTADSCCCEFVLAFIVFEATAPDCNQMKASGNLKICLLFCYQLY